MLLFVITVGSTLLFTGNLFKKESTFKQETTVFVEQIQELATLATTEAHLKTVIKQEDNKLFSYTQHLPSMVMAELNSQLWITHHFG